MAKSPRGRYTQELKQQAVSMVVSDGFGVAEAARRLSLCSKTLSNWVKQYQQDAQGFLAKPGASEESAELARLCYQPLTGQAAAPYIGHRLQAQAAHHLHHRF